MARRQLFDLSTVARKDRVQQSKTSPRMEISESAGSISPCPDKVFDIDLFVTRTHGCMHEGFEGTAASSMDLSLSMSVIMSMSMDSLISMSMDLGGGNSRNHNGHHPTQSSSGRRPHSFVKRVQTQGPSHSWGKNDATSYPKSKDGPTAALVQESLLPSSTLPGTGDDNYDPPPSLSRTSAIPDVGPVVLVPSVASPDVNPVHSMVWTPSKSSDVPRSMSHSPNVFTKSTIKPTYTRAPIIRSQSYPAVLFTSQPSVRPMPNQHTPVYTGYPLTHGPMSPPNTKQPGGGAGTNDAAAASPSGAVYRSSGAPQSLADPLASLTYSPSSSFPQQCQTINGVYGSLDGVCVGVVFGYALETISIGDDELLYEVMPTLEVAFNDFLLPFLDPDHCQLNTRQLSHIDERHLLAVIGISSHPDDLRVEPCSQKMNVGNNCSVFRGELSLYMVGFAATSAVVVETKKHLIVGFNVGAFDSADARIVRVSYVDLAQGEGSTNPIESQEEPPTQAEGKSRLALISVLTVFAVLALLVFGATIAYRHNAEESSQRRQFEAMLDDADDDVNHMVDTGEVGIPEQIALQAVMEEEHALDDSDAELGSDRMEERQPYITEVSSLYLEKQADGELVVKTTCPTTSNFSESEDPMECISPSDSSVYMEDQDNVQCVKDHLLHSLASDQDSQMSTQFRL
ncbi:hypothetical protein MPSEU_000101800 [Mayamaea pseudoterrestris]|nr:hypothetical protein MPSEU_000101800 [Mayamaea pseudoterrestris]